MTHKTYNVTKKKSENKSKGITPLEVVGLVLVSGLIFFGVEVDNLRLAVLGLIGLMWLLFNFAIQEGRNEMPRM